MRIVDARTGGAPTFGQYVGRYLAYFLAILPLGLGLIYLYAQGRIEAFTALAAVLAMALLMIVLAALADVAAEDRRRSRGRFPAQRP